MRIERDYELKRHTTFQIGGKAPAVYFPETKEEFVSVLKEYPTAIIIGNGSDLLISSSGVDNAVIITSDFNTFEIEDTKITVSAGTKVPLLSRKAAEAGLSGFEFMIGIPGSVGGTVCMNASAHGQSVSDVFVKSEVYDITTGDIITLSKEDMEFGYRKSVISEKRYVVLTVEFELKRDDKTAINALVERNLEFRKQKQPSLALPNAGSVFKNPENDSAGRLLDKAGVKSLTVGGAKVWENHANFIVNIGYAVSGDVLKLMCEMHERVKEKYTVKLHPEVKFIGIAGEEERELWNKINE